MAHVFVQTVKGEKGCEVSTSPPYWSWIRSQFTRDSPIVHTALPVVDAQVQTLISSMEDENEGHTMQQTASLDTETDVTPIRKLQPGDVLDVVISLRRLMSQCETASYILYASFAEFGDPCLDKEAAKARHTLELSTARIATLLGSLEKTPAYQELRRETLARRKSRISRNT